MRVVIATDGFLEADTTPAMPHDLRFVRHDDPVAVASAVREAEALVTRRVDVTPALLDGAPLLRGVLQVGVGTDRIDLVAAAARGVAVANTPGAVSAAVVEHSFLLMLAAFRGLPRQFQAMADGGWSGAEVWEGEEIGGKTLGILGYGSIGEGLAARAVAFGMRVLVHTRRRRAALPPGVTQVDLDTLLREADALVIAAALNEETRGMIGRDRLAMMKPGALVVNIARGALLDEEALVEAVRDGRLRGALDAFRREPLPADSLMRGLPGLVATPHTAGSTQQSRARIWAQMVANLGRLARHESMLNLVNQPLPRR